MTYSESASGVIITKGRAYREIAAHGLQEDWLDFLSYAIADKATTLDDEGNIVTLDARIVFDWLGY